MAFDTVGDSPDPNNLQQRKYLGTVVENDDPLMIERVKVTIPEMFEGPAESLPWVARNSTGSVPGGTDGFGHFNLPPRKGVQLVVFFQDGNPQYPMYEAYPIQTDERPTEGQTNYLYRYGHKDPRSNVFFIDTLESADPQAYLKLAAGVEISVGDTAKVRVTIDDDVTGELKAKLNLHIVDDVTITADANVNITIQGNCTTNVTGNMTTSVQGNMTSTVQGTLTMVAQGPASLTSATMVSVNAPIIGMTGPSVSLSAQNDINITSTAGTVTIKGPNVRINP
jgi:hypothetical protein